MKTKKHRRLLCLFFTLCILFCRIPAPVVHAEESQEEDKDRTRSPYFYVESGEIGADSFPLKKTTVNASIDGIIADTYVTQVYANEGTGPINASYVFPASTRVTIHGMQMQVGNQRVTAAIREKEEAAEEFEAAKSEGKTASMLSEQRANVFTMDVANIMPGDEVRIELHYTELIMPTDGTYQFVFPTVVGPRYVGPVIDDCGNREEWTGTPYMPEGSLPENAYEINVRVTSGVPVSALSSSTHDVSINWNEAKTTAQVALANPADYAGNRDFVLDYRLSGEAIRTGLLMDSNENENVFMLMVQPPERCTTEEIPPREYIFVLDVSGSMYGFPLDTAKALIRDLVSGLRETDTFNLILFSGTSYQMSPRSVPATKENIDKAIGLVDAQDGAGGTELLEALEDALRIPADKDTARGIVVISDGYIWGEAGVFELIHQNQGKADFFSFGIGYAVNRYLMEGIARTGQGESFIVMEEEEAAAAADKFRAYIQSPLLTDIQVAFDGFDAYDVEPAALPTLYASRPIVLLGKWNGEAAGTIRITGKTGNGEFAQEIDVSGAAAGSSDALGYLWARKRVERLTDYGVSNGNPDVRDEVTQLGLSYHMITPYTAFIAVIDTIRNPDGSGTDVDQPLPLPLEVSNLAVGYRIGSEPGEILLFAALILMIFLPALWKKLKKEKVDEKEAEEKICS
ncbi:MAG: VIT and VWA domain-containing protein [Blautia sp.]|nr:VIT and VWA domain-containing protein [Blautia sp.]MCM1201347.1 VIT and VWA domain-containing protein [Bacteroides fragilis]